MLVHRTRTCDPRIRVKLRWTPSYAAAVTLCPTRPERTGKGVAGATSEPSCSNASSATAPLPRDFLWVDSEDWPTTSDEVLRSLRAAENRCPATLSARLPGHREHCGPCRPVGPPARQLLKEAQLLLREALSTCRSGLLKAGASAPAAGSSNQLKNCAAALR